MSSPQAVKDCLRLEIGALEHEVFCVLFLDAQHRIIALKQMFRGTVTQTSVYPREVVKEALAVNAAAVVLAHNHPSGSVDPSRADEFLTQTLKSALALVDVRVLDHLVVAGADVCSFAERGLVEAALGASAAPLLHALRPDRSAGCRARRRRPGVPRSSGRPGGCVQGRVAVRR